MTGLEPSAPVPRDADDMECDLLDVRALSGLLCLALDQAHRHGGLPPQAAIGARIVAAIIDERAIRLLDDLERLRDEGRLS